MDQEQMEIVDAVIETVMEPKKEEVKKEEIKREEVKAISISSKGLVEAKDNAELLRYCAALVKAEMVPDRYNTPQKLFGALMFVRSLGLPDTSIRQVAMIHGTPSLFGDLPLALVQASGDLLTFSEKWFDRNYDVICFENKNLNAPVYGSVCFVKRKGEDVAESFSFTLDDATIAGLYPDKNPNKPWSKYTKIMLRYKARALALKSKFADKISGVAIAEYDEDILGSEDMRDVSKPNAADELTKALE
jgi:hypothetical protein